MPGKSSLGQARVFINDVSVCQIKKNRSDFKPDPGGHRPRRPYAQGRTHTHTHIYIYSAICMYVYTNLKISAGGRANGGDAENGVLHGESPKRLAPPRNVVYRGRCVRSSRAQEDNATVAKSPRCREAALHADVSLVCSFMNRQPKSTAVLGPRGQHAYAHIRMGSYKRVKGRSHTVEKRKAIHPQRPHATSQPSRLQCMSQQY